MEVGKALARTNRKSRSYKKYLAEAWEMRVRE